MPGSTTSSLVSAPPIGECPPPGSPLLKRAHGRLDEDAELCDGHAPLRALRLWRGRSNRGGCLLTRRGVEAPAHLGGSLRAALAHRTSKASCSKSWLSGSSSTRPSISDRFGPRPGDRRAIRADRFRFQPAEHERYVCVFGGVRKAPPGYRLEREATIAWRRPDRVRTRYGRRRVSTSRRQVGRYQMDDGQSARSRCYLCRHRSARCHRPVVDASRSLQRRKWRSAKRRTVLRTYSRLGVRIHSGI